jgi:PKD domain
MRKLRQLSTAVVFALMLANGAFAGIIGTGPEPPPEPPSATAPGIIGTVPSDAQLEGGGAVTLNASFTDPGGSGLRTAEITWGDGLVTNLSNLTGTTLTSTHAYSAAGSYTITVKVTRGSTFGTSTFSPVIVYDPNLGSVKGSGWFNSPLGAYPAKPSFADKVHFGFEVQYPKNQTTPTGTRGLTLTIPGLNFAANRYDWLVINGPQAQFMGAGSVNGVNGFDFVVTGLDGKLEGKKIPDKLRIRIWNHATGQVVYDSQLDGPNSAAPAVALGGGEVTIHK